MWQDVDDDVQVFDPLPAAVDIDDEDDYRQTPHLAGQLFLIWWTHLSNESRQVFLMKSLH